MNLSKSGKNVANKFPIAKNRSFSNIFERGDSRAEFRRLLVRWEKQSR